MKDSSESVQQDVLDASQKATDEFGQRVDELQQSALLLFLISQIQVQAYLQTLAIQGIPISSWYQDIGITVYRRVYAQSASSIANGDDPRDVVIQLTKAGPGSLLSSIKSNLSTIVHGIGTGAMQLVTLANARLFVGEIWSSIIDDVTCRICRERNGQFYPLDSSGNSTAPPQPAHRSCRCNMVPTVSSEESEGTRMPRSFDSWLRDHPDMQAELLGSRASRFADGHLHIASFIDYRKNFQIPAQSYPELNSLIWQLSQ